MFDLKTVVASTVVLSVLTCLPAATRCDTSYYEKYYSAWRFIPMKRNVMLQFNFTVTISRDSPPLADYEQMALVGNIKQLGSWRAEQAIILNRTDTHNTWSGQVQLPQNSTVEYRYFIAAVTRDDLLRKVQIRHWESYINARNFNTTEVPGNRTDTFGIIEGCEEIQRGWLNTGQIVQFKLFHNPLTIDEDCAIADELRVRVQPVDPISLTPILPSARATVEYVRMAYGDSHLRLQPEFGVPYNHNDILIFHTTVAQLDNVAFQFKVYTTKSNSEMVRLLGYQYIQPSRILNPVGINLQLISPIWLNTIGHLELKYLLIDPMPNSIFDFRTSFVNYWRTNWTALEIGHRGLGKSLSVATNPPPIIENTIASMKAAADLGADIVEFDVQVTSDLVPIISHDFSIRVCIDSKTPTTKNDLTEVLIKDITYEQLKDLKTYQIIGAKIIEYPAHNSVERSDQRLFPTLENLFMDINLDVGFDIEIKWPQLKSDGTYESEQTVNKNLFVDRILEVVQRVGCGRFNVFKSFDADICTLLRFKQNMYPVMFLTSYKEYKFADPRSHTILNSINFAQAFNLAGIVPNAIHIKSNPSLIQLAKSQLPLILLWGSDIKNRESIDWFKALGVSGVIYDRMDLWLPTNKTNAFKLENDFFRLQCKPVSKKSVVNETTENISTNVNLL